MISGAVARVDVAPLPDVLGVAAAPLTGCWAISCCKAAKSPITDAAKSKE